MKEIIPADIYDEECGIWLLTVDTKALGNNFKTLRDSIQN